MTQIAAEAVSSVQEISAAEREFASNYLASTRDALVEALSGLSDSQWKFRSAPDRWSIAEIMEHVAFIEGRIQEIIGNLKEAPADLPMREVKQVDEFVLYMIPSRELKVRAPERIRPTGRWAGPEAREVFLNGRKKTFELLAATPHLRGRVLPHPIFGAWDGYQWILAAAGHAARHTSQICELKADPKFPAA